MRCSSITWMVSAAMSHLVLASCVGAPQELVEIPLLAAGREVSTWETPEGFTLLLTRADVAFGPLYVCAGTQAGANCETARLEWRESAVVNALSEERQPLGNLMGMTGSVRSWMFDYGITSLLTQETPKVMPAAQELGGVSLVLEGLAVISGTEVPFSARVAVQLGEADARGAPAVSKSTSDVFSGEVTTDTQALEVQFDPSTWAAALRRVHFEEAVVGCTIGTDESCPGVDFEPSSRAAVVIDQAMTSGARPTFTLK